MKAKFNVLFQFVVVIGMLPSQGLDFELLTDPRMCMWSLGPGWISASHFSCALACLKMASECFSFTFNVISKRCMPGSWSWYNDTSAVVARDSLYSAALCRLDLGFTMTVTVNGTTCHWLSAVTDRRNYTDAALACRDKGLQLITMNTVNKVYQFLNLAKDINIKSFWIGLNDMANESVYRWEGDDVPATNDVLKIVFRPPEPLDVGDEDCVEYTIDRYPGNDALCSLLKQYMCEVVPPELEGGTTSRTSSARAQRVESLVQEHNE